MCENKLASFCLSLISLLPQTWLFFRLSQLFWVLCENWEYDGGMGKSVFYFCLWLFIGNALTLILVHLFQIFLFCLYYYVLDLFTGNEDVKADALVYASFENYALKSVISIVATVMVGVKLFA